MVEQHLFPTVFFSGGQTGSRWSIEQRLGKFWQKQRCNIVFAFFSVFHLCFQMKTSNDTERVAMTHQKCHDIFHFML